MITKGRKNTSVGRIQEHWKHRKWFFSFYRFFIVFIFSWRRSASKHFSLFEKAVLGELLIIFGSKCPDTYTDMASARCPPRDVTRTNSEETSIWTCLLYIALHRSRAYRSAISQFQTRLELEQNRLVEIQLR